MNDHPPEHHIHHTLELIRVEAESDPSGPVSKSLAHRIAFLEKNCTDYAINSAKPAEKSARWAMYAAIVAAIAAIVQIVISICVLL